MNLLLHSKNSFKCQTLSLCTFSKQLSNR
uniref:Uncharacterized protein n=1 Tax=Anguilla anguilla TaxID=7936 RepID=A0A0E9P8L9_ANGAN